MCRHTFARLIRRVYALNLRAGNSNLSFETGDFEHFTTCPVLLEVSRLKFEFWSIDSVERKQQPQRSTKAAGGGSSRRGAASSSILGVQRVLGEQHAPCLLGGGGGCRFTGVEIEGTPSV